MALSWPATKQQKVILEMLQILLHKSAILYIHIYIYIYMLLLKHLIKKELKILFIMLC